MLKTMLEKNLYSVHDGFDNWEDALRAAVVPMVRSNIVTERYADSIIAAVHQFGPYIVIAPDICIPHANDPENVNESAICFMKTVRPVSFGDEPDESARLFFVLAAKDEKIHLQNMRALMKLLSDPALMEPLSEVTCEEELLALM